MVGSDDLSVRGGFNGEEVPLVARAELRQLGNSLLETMKRMFNERILVAGGQGPRHQYEDNHREEYDDENSGFCNGFHDRFGNGPGDRGGGRRVDCHDQHGGGHGRDRHGHFDDEEEVHDNYDQGFD